MSRVYWLTGLSGAGKTTIGTLLYQKLREEQDNVVFLDGDQLRQVFGDDLGYTPEQRLKSAMRNARLCKLLFDQGLDVVCCTISMFDSVRDWNRTHIPGYCEIYVKASMETLRRRDQKGLYSQGENDVAGVHFAIEEPKEPDLILCNDGEKTPEEQAQKIMEVVAAWN
ncbi:adenylyl-sulfate kinase [Flavonifractor sp. An306]|uniref:adenylyl-sulfate kinase n=1 Tax=Flavonifractor sp. An306 TaxID=1965629 RepID=UPI000B3A692F|nr:adenylyl-sulfate kinase [Flavonifractor sp. An306]OUO41059.1 adenylyl-sulfate kinase [Flavonifractor sp. An306]